MTDYKLVSVDTLKSIHRDLDACQKVIWLAGGFDPAYCEDAQARLKEIDELLAAPAVQGEVVAWLYEKDGSESSIRTLRQLIPSGSGWKETPLYAAPHRAEHQPAPDVAGLVEALKSCRDELLWMIERHNQQDQSDGSWLYDYQTLVEVDAALAAHRKQGDGA